MKNRRTAIVSGLLAAVCMVSAVLQPLAVSAAAAVPPSYPGLTEVREQLDDDEIVSAGDITVEAGSGFDIGKDRTGFTIPDESKASVVFDAAEDADGTGFSIDREADYTAKYHVDLRSGHPSYRISRTICVKKSAGKSAAKTQESSPNSGAVTDTMTADKGGETDSTEAAGHDDSKTGASEDEDDGSDMTADEDPIEGTSDGAGAFPALLEEEQIADGSEIVVGASSESVDASVNVISVATDGPVSVMHFYQTVGNSGGEVAVYCGEFEAHFESGAHTRQNLVGTSLQGHVVTEADVIKVGLMQDYFFLYAGVENEIARALTQRAVWCIASDEGYINSNWLEIAGMTATYEAAKAYAAEHASKAVIDEAYALVAGDSQKMVVIHVIKKTEPEQGKAKLVKKSSDSSTDGNGAYSLEGAVYGVYSDSACTKKVGTLTTGASGTSNTVSLDAGTYYVKETTAPKGFKVDTKAHKVTVKENETTTVSVTDTPEKGPVYVRKTSEDGSGIPVTGTVYSFYSDPSCKVKVHDFTIGADGKSDTISVIYGYYYLVETKAAPGYRLDETVHKILINSTGTKEIKMTDELFRAGVRFEKWDSDTKGSRSQGGAVLQGAEIKITNKTGNVVAVGGKEYADGSVVLTLTTDAEGKAESAKDVLPVGKYAWKETKAPSGYKLSGTTGGSFTVTDSDAGTLIDLTGKGPVDDVIRGGVRIRKQDAGYKDRSSQGDAELSGAAFAITNQNKKSVFVDGKEYKTGEIVGTIYTDAEGIAETAGDFLPYGSYGIREAAPSTGYLINAEWSLTFEISTDGKIVDLTGKACDEEVIRGGVSICKYDKELGNAEPVGGASLKGIEFEIRNASSGRVTVSGTDCKKGDVAAHIVTDSGGKGSLPADTLPYGTYTIQETKRNGSYLLTDGKARTFQIRKNGETVAAGTDGKKLIFRDQVVRNDICFKKVAAHTNDPLQHVAFKVTNKTTGETHVIVTDKDGSYDSGAVPHTGSTNVNDHVLEGYKEGTVIKTADLKAEAGTWFGSGQKGNGADPDDSLGAFPYGEYVMEELRCENNEGYDLISTTFFIDKDSSEKKTIDLGTFTDEEVVPKISTTAVDPRTGEHLAACGEGDLLDTVHCDGLVPGRSYVLKASLVDENGTIVKYNRKEVTGETSFTADRSVMDVEVGIGIFNSEGNEGRVLTVFEELYEKELVGTGRLLASHKDVNDTAQQIRIPKIRTNAEDLQTKSHTGSIGKAVKIKDTVTYEGLLPGKEYTVTGTLRVKDTGDVLKDAGGDPVTEEKTFTPAEASGSVELVFTIDSRLLRGRTVVAFEDIRYEKIIVAVHGDINDHDQSIYFPKIGTVLNDKDTGKHEVQADSSVTLTDTVFYENLPADGKTAYVMTGTIILKPETEGGKQEILMEDGKPVTASVRFTPEAAEGKIALAFKVNASLLEGREVVAFENCTDAATGAQVASHEDINDEGQTVRFINIGTKAEAEDTGLQETQAGKKEVFIDHVSYTGLTVGKEYTLKGKLMLSDIGKPLMINNKAVTAELRFKPEKSDGTVDMTFIFDSSAIAGKRVVTFEDLYDEDVKIAAHADITDKEQTVSVIGIGTKAEAKDTGVQETQVSAQTVITDHVTYTGLTVGKEYTLQGQLMLADTGKVLTVNGKAVTAGLKFKPEKTDGIVDMTFTFDSAALAGKKTVVFEDLYDGKLKIASHADITDEGQTVEFIDIGTKAEAKDTGTQETQASEKTVFIDHVTYTGLTIGKEYTVKGQLMLAETGKALLIDGKPVTSELKFKPEKADGIVDMTFTFDSRSVAGKKVVTFEDLYDEKIKIAAHADITDRDQSVDVVKMGTKAEAKDTGTRETQAGEQTVIIDHVTYTGLTVGKEYALKGQLMLAGTGKALTVNGKAVTAGLKFKPEKADGIVDMTFTFDSTALAGKKTVVFEDLYDGKMKIASHADITDEGQTVEFIDIGTKAEAKDTGTQETQASEKTVFVDHVTYTGLTIGKEYTLKGQLMLAETGKALLIDGNPVTSELKFKPEKADGAVDMTFIFDSRAVAGKKVVTFEDLYDEKVKIAAHADITDKDQSVDIVEIGTKAEAKDTGTRETQAGKQTVIVDHVTYTGLTAGKEYILKGQLVLAESGKVLTIDGRNITSELKFKPEKADGVVDMTFTFDSSSLAGRKTVVFEDLYDEKVKIASHADIADEGQTVEFIDIGTKAEAKDTGTQETQVSEKTVFIDHVTYTGLTIGKEYTVKGQLMLAETGKALLIDGRPVTSELKFKPEKADGIVDMTFTFDSRSVAGKKVVTFEDLYDEKVKIVAHADITDEDQSVNIVKIGTKAEAKDTGTHETQEAAQTVIIDHVTYSGLTVGKEYMVKGRLMLAETGEDLTVDGRSVTSELKFRPEKTDGIVDMTFTFDSTAIVGQKTVVFEDLYDEKVKIASHADITDEDQTVKVINISTRAEAKDTGTQETQASEKTVFIDHVTYTGLTIGKEYTLKGQLMLAETGDALAVEGNPVTSELKFTPEKADGVIDMTFIFDSRAVAGKKIVTFEDLYDEKVKIAAHADITDEDQSVNIVKIGTKAEAKDTGTNETQEAGQTVIIDHVTYSGLTVGKEYTLKGQLMLAETGKVLTIDGRNITSELKFKPEKADGVVDMAFTFDSTVIAGKKTVVFEDLYAEGVKVASHADITDKDQSVEIRKKPTPTPTPVTKKTPTPVPPTPGRTTTTASPVKTGDTSQPVLWILLGAGAIIIVASMFLKKRNP